MKQATWICVKLHQYQETKEIDAVNQPQATQVAVSVLPDGRSINPQEPAMTRTRPEASGAQAVAPVLPSSLAQTAQEPYTRDACKQEAQLKGLIMGLGSSDVFNLFSCTDSS